MIDIIADDTTLFAITENSYQTTECLTRKVEPHAYHEGSVSTTEALQNSKSGGGSIFN